MTTISPAKTNIPAEGRCDLRHSGSLNGGPIFPSGQKQTCRTVRFDVRFSNRPSGVKRFQTIHHHSVQCRSRARASLRNRHQGPSIMGFEDGVEQSLPRPCHQTSDRSKRTYELTSSIVPRGTSFHGLVEFEFSPIAFGYLRPSCYCGLSGPPELSAF